MPTLSVPITDSLALDAGTCVGSAAAVTILPPSVSMLDQLLSPRFTSRTWSLTESSSRIDLESPPDPLSDTQ